MARILVVDDCPYVRLSFRHVLERAGHTILEAADGLEAVQVYRDSPADLVLLDLYLPRLDGLAVLEQPSALAPRVRVVAMTGGAWDASTALVEEVERLGLTLLRKPFGRAVLLAAVARGLAGG